LVYKNQFRKVSSESKFMKKNPVTIYSRFLALKTRGYRFHETTAIIDKYGMLGKNVLL